MRAIFEVLAAYLSSSRVSPLMSGLIRGADNTPGLCELCWFPPLFIVEGFAAYAWTQLRRVSQLIVVVEGFVAHVGPYMMRRAACTRLMRTIRVSAHFRRRGLRRLLSPSSVSSLTSGFPCGAEHALSPSGASQLVAVVEGFGAYVGPYMRRRACTRIM